MPNKTIYIKEEDMQIFNRAQALGGESISSVITESLRRYVLAEQEKNKKEEEARQIQNIMEDLVQKNASVIHLQPTREGNCVRIRVDGVLYQIDPIPQNLYKKVIKRIKELAFLKINETFAQDNKMRLEFEDKTLDILVCVVPTVLGEAVTMRILEKGKNIPEVKQLEPGAEHSNELQQLVSRRHGLIFVTGPTNSGKTTTLYSLLKYLPRDKLKVMTVEHPVELLLEHCVQLPVGMEKETSFSSLLRPVLRSDADVIMVGEIRDQETAQLCVQMALTGHLVLSVLHTHSAASALSRLLDIGIEPYLLRDALTGVVGQRLVRRLCQHCKAQDKVRKTDFPPLSLKGQTFFKAVGCTKCVGGYSGQLPLFEILKPTKTIQQAILDKKDGVEMDKIAKQEGFATLIDDGIQKAAKGDTSLTEIMRVMNADKNMNVKK